MRHRCREQTYGHQGGKATGWRGGGVMIWEIGIDIYTLICIKWITHKNMLYKKINKIKFKTNKQAKKPTVRYHIIPGRMAKIKKTDHIIC